MTNELLCVYYDCSGFDFTIEEPKMKIDGPIEISERNNVGKINKYFQNYEFSFEVNVEVNLTSIGWRQSILGPLQKHNIAVILYLE